MRAAASNKNTEKFAGKTVRDKEMVLLLENLSEAADTVHILRHPVIA